jgi:hypothetical protein
MLKHRIVAGAFLLAIASAAAGDRPYSALTTAAAEEDDDRVWSFDATIGRLGTERALDTQAEYAFDPTTSVQFGYGLARERRSASKTQAVETEIKQLFNHIARDGWDWGVSLSHAWIKAPQRAWRGGHWELTAPFSLQLGQGDALLHANVGWSKSSGESSERFVAFGGETDIVRRTVLFGELAREGEATFASVGVRHWIQRERLAVDVSLQRQRGDGSRASGFIVGMSWYDL